MTRKSAFLSLITIISIMTACHKSSDKAATTTTITDSSVATSGSWKLLSIGVTESTWAKQLNPSSADTLSGNWSNNYTITNVSGTFLFKTDSLYMNSFSFSKDTSYWGAIYVNGAVMDSGWNEQNVSIDTTNLAFPMHWVSGQDSLTFPNGSLPFYAVGIPVQLNAKGGKYAINGNTMTLDLKADSAAIIPDNGDIVDSIVARSHLVLTLQKQ